MSQIVTCHVWRTFLDAANVCPFPFASLLSLLKIPVRRDKFTIHSKAVVCQDVELKGDITIGAGTST